MFARMNVAAGLAAAALAVIAAVAPVAAAPHIAQAFSPATDALRAVAFPVLLPTTFADMADLQRDRLYVPVVATAHHYALKIDFAPDCGGANVCSAGSFEAYDAHYTRGKAAALPRGGPRRPDAADREAIGNGSLVLDRPTPLAGGHTGYYTESRSGADDGGNSSLRWHDRGIEYSLTTRISDRETLARIANSAIQNGPLF